MLSAFAISLPYLGVKYLEIKILRRPRKVKDFLSIRPTRSTKPGDR